VTVAAFPFADGSAPRLGSTAGAQGDGNIQFVKPITREVNLLLERPTGDIIAIGQNLIEMKNRLGHGHWRAWLLTQWPLDLSLANRWMNVARRCGQYPHPNIPRSPLYLLAASSTPDTFRAEFVRRVEAGQPPMPSPPRLTKPRTFARRASGPCWVRLR
jgi:hypothetical protein